MQIQSYNAELAIANLMFLRLFNNIIIQRTGKNNNTKDIKVNCQLGQKSRIFKNWQNDEKRAKMKLPMIVINRTGYTRNAERLNNMHNEVKYEMTSKYRKYDLLTPVPIDINYDVSIISKYPSDIDQIASNFMIFFNPDVYVTCMHPKYEDIKLNNQIIMQDSISEEHPDEIDGSTDDFITNTFQFTFKTYLFGGNQQAKKIPKYTLSTYLSTFNKDVVYELTENDMRNLSNFTDYKLSTTIEKTVTEKLSAYVENPDSIDQVYDGFVPIAKNITVGFYPVTDLDNFKSYIQEVNNLDPNWMYVDKVKWVVDEDINSIYKGNLLPVLAPVSSIYEISC